MQLEKRYNPKTSEPRWQEYWATHRIFAFDPEDPRPVYSVDTPPPTVSADRRLPGSGCSPPREGSRSRSPAPDSHG